MGVMVGLLFYFKTEDTYEKKLFSALAQNVYAVVPDKTDSAALLLKSLHLVHNAVQPRQGTFSNIGGFKASVFQPVTIDLQTGQGACGSYATVLARLMDDLGLEARMAQMKVGEEYGGHILVEAKIGSDWVVVDPLYNMFLTRPDGKLASFNDVQQNWDFYKQQVPEEYDMSYKYEGVRYTNWDKVPVLMPAFKKLLDFFMGKEAADTISLRIIMMRKFNVFFLITLFLFVVAAVYTSFLIWKNKEKTAQAPMKDTGRTTPGKIAVVNPATNKPQALVNLKP